MVPSSPMLDFGGSGTDKGGGGVVDRDCWKGRGRGRIGEGDKDTPTLARLKAHYRGTPMPLTKVQVCTEGGGGGGKLEVGILAEEG